MFISDPDFSIVQSSYFMVAWRQSELIVEYCLYAHVQWVVRKFCHCSNMLYLLIQLIIPHINTLGPKRNQQHFADDIFKRIFFNENVWISINISLKFDPKGPINNIPALVQIMAWRRSGDKPLSEPMMVRLPTHICVTRPQWVKLTYMISNVFLKVSMTRVAGVVKQSALIIAKVSL